MVKNNKEEQTPKGPTMKTTNQKQEFRVTFDVQGRRITQRRPGPDAQEAWARVQREYAKKPYWGMPKLYTVVPVAKAMGAQEAI